MTEYYMSEFNRFYNFSLRASTMMGHGDRCWFAHFNVEGDFTRLFPFVLATATKAIHYENPEYVQFRLYDIVCNIYRPNVVVARLFYGKEQALEFAHKLIDYLKELENKKSQIRPILKKSHRVNVPDLLPFLPMTNCGKCGFQTCIAFAAAVSRRKAIVVMCQYFPEPDDAKIIYSINNQTSGKINSIEIDSDLAGIPTAKLNALNTTEPLVEKKNVKMRTKSLVASRNDVVFKISGREVEVLRLITEGFKNKEIAQILHISSNTVKSHVCSIFDKIGVNDRTQAAVWAIQNELF